MPWVGPAIIGGSALASSVIGAMSSKGGSSDVDYKWPKEQQLSWSAGFPFMKGVAGYGMQNLQQPYMGAPMMGAPPSIYNVPNTRGLMPNQGWFDNLDSSITAGMWEPWNEASDQMMANMSGVGQFGSPRGGISGAGLNAQGSLYADAGKQVGSQAWDMISPIQQAEWGAQLGRNIQDYQSSLIPWQQNFQSQQEAWRMPFQLTPGMVTGNYPTGIVTQQGNPWAGALSGAATGAMYGMSMMGNQGQGNYGQGYSPFTSGTANIGGPPVDQWQYGMGSQYGAGGYYQ